MLYVDSNVFIYPAIYDPGDERAKRSRDLLLKIASGEVEASTSLLTWDEVVWVVRKLAGVEASVRQGALLLNFPHLRFLSVTESTVLRARMIMEEYGLKPRGSLHAASALESGIRIVASYDEDFDRIRGIERVEP